MRIIHGTDFTENAARAGRVAAAIAARMDDTLLLVHSLEAGVLGAISSGPLTKVPGAATDELQKTAERLREQGAMVKTALLTGAANEAIVKKAAPGGTRLVVVGSLGRRAVERWRLGSVSERVAETARVPTLVVRQEEALVAWARDERPLKMICAYDFSPSADAALAYLKQFRSISPCEIVVVQVDWPLGEKMRLGVPGPVTMVANHPEVQALLERDLRAKVTAVLGEKGVRVRVEPGLGRPDFRLIEIAGQEQADLVVTGTHQRHGWSRLWHVSTSRGLLHYAPMSVLVVPATTGLAKKAISPVRRVLVTTDFSELGNQAIHHAYSVLPSGGTVLLLHVRSPTSPGKRLSGIISQEAHSGPPPHKVTRVERQLRALIPPQAEASGINSEVEVAEHRKPATAICQAAERFGADVICLGTHGRSGLSAAVLGSVANGVMAGSKRPLLIVRPPVS